MYANKYTASTFNSIIKIHKEKSVKYLQTLKKPSAIILIVVLLISIIFTTLAYRLVVMTKLQSTPQTNSPGVTVTIPPRPTLSSGPAPILPVQSPAKVLGIEGSPQIYYASISWVRLGTPSCGSSKLQGDALKNALDTYHRHGIRVLLTLCQNDDLTHLFDSAPLFDAAQARPDAVQCGNEEMKVDSSVAFLHISPENFARFYDLCQYEVHAVRPDIPVLLGSLDPHVASVDTQALSSQVNYLNQMQKAMNTTIHPGGHWDWHTQTLGLIDSWHNGWNNGGPDASVNNLQNLFNFWAQQFKVDLNSGGLGKHLWVVEGTGCFKGCGVDANDPAQVAVSHLLSLVTDVQTAIKYGIPFFYFSGIDFNSAGYYWPIGVLDIHGRPKPLRQDLALGARTLTLSCHNGKVSVIDQEQLLARMYSGCTVSDNYESTIAN